MEVVYVGQSKNLHQRIDKHHIDGEKDFDRYFLYPCPMKMLDKFERHYIAMFYPKYNVRKCTMKDMLTSRDAQEAYRLRGERGKENTLPQIYPSHSEESV